MTSTLMADDQSNLASRNIPLLFSSVYIDDSNGNRKYCVRDNPTELYTLALFQILKIDGISSVCNVVDITLDMSLTCWYEASCFEPFRLVLFSQFVRGPINILLLDPTQPIRFWPQSQSLRRVYNNMMIEIFNSSVSYEAFYETCHPLYCTFTYTEHAHIIVIITTLIGLFGGLNVILRLLSRFLVKLFFTCIATNSNATRSIAQSQNNRWTKYKEQLVMFNRFSDGSQEIHVIKRQRIFTRLYLLLILISFMVIIVYTAMEKNVVIKIVESPSQAQYNELLGQYSSTIQCPCTAVSMDLSQLVSVNAIYHQVCSSAFVETEWIYFLFNDINRNNYKRADIRVRGGAYFRFLSKLCALMNTTTQTLAQEFFADSFTSAKAISEDEFQSRMNVLQYQFQTSIELQLTHGLKIVRDITQANIFVSSYMLNYQTTLDTKFIEFYNTSSHRHVLDLGGSVFQSPSATVKLDNRTYLSTYNTFDSKAIPYFFLLMIDVKTKSIKLNVSLIEKNDYAGFYHIGVTHENGNIYGIRESFKSPLSLEVANINQTTGLMKSIGIYPAGSFSIIIAFASKRRLYYNVIDSTLYGINIDTGKLEVHSQIPGDYSIYALDYDSAKDRLIALVYPAGLNDGVWYLVEVIMKAKGELEFDRIGKSEIPFEKYFWSTNYALDAEKRLWVTLWGTTDNKKNYFFVFNIDNGKIVEQMATNLTELSNLACFDSI
ncbi:unnamed protein product [Rotaria socialis]|nr:unnamed protein product [Rotaria socialis]